MFYPGGQSKEDRIQAWEAYCSRLWNGLSLESLVSWRLTDYSWEEPKHKPADLKNLSVVSFSLLCEHFGSLVCWVSNCVPSRVAGLILVL